MKKVRNPIYERLIFIIYASYSAKRLIRLHYMPSHPRTCVSSKMIRVWVSVQILNRVPKHPCIDHFSKHSHDGMAVDWLLWWVLEGFVAWPRPYSGMRVVSETSALHTGH
ncbi:unnamed protein product, partial [Vitis vinifera]